MSSCVLNVYLINSHLSDRTETLSFNNLIFINIQIKLNPLYSLSLQVMW